MRSLKAYSLGAGVGTVAVMATMTRLELKKRQGERWKNAPSQTVKRTTDGLFWFLMLGVSACMGGTAGIVGTAALRRALS